LGEALQLVGPIPAHLDLGPEALVDGVLAREILGDWSHLEECDRPPRFVVEENLVSAKRSPFDRSEDRADVVQAIPGRDIKELKDRHSGACIILFNGWSLAHHDLNELKYVGLPIIGINRTHVGFPGYKGPEPDYLCAVDRMWVQDHRVRRHPGLVNGSVEKDAVGYRATRNFRMTPFSRDIGRDGYPPFIPGTTGFLALHLAVYLGFTELYCLGLDLCGQHFDGTKGSLHFSHMRAHFERMAPKLLEHAKVYVVGSPDSKAPASFGRLSYDEMLGRFREGQQ
jgi:hypothetical protein